MNTTFLARRIRQLSVDGEEAMAEAITLAHKHLDPDEYRALVQELSPRRP